MRTPTVNRLRSTCILLTAVVFGYAVASRAVEAVRDNSIRATSSIEKSVKVRTPRIALSISAVAGSGQTARINSSFAIQLQALLTDDDVPQTGVQVNFAAPTDGAGGTFDGGNSEVEVTTDDNGIATATVFTANGVAGSYQVSATTSDVSTTFDLTNLKGDQAIDFPAISDKTFGDPPFDVPATASSGLPVNLSVVSGPAAITDRTLTLLGVGAVTIRASQPGDENYEAADSVEQSFTVNKAEQTISFDPIPNQTYGAPDFDVAVTASSGLDVTLAASGRCTVAAFTVHLTGAGSCTLTASQGGDENFNFALNVRRSFFIANPGEQLFDLRSFGAVGDGVTDDAPALQAALDAIATAGGGTVVIPEGRYALVTSVTKNFGGLSSPVSIRGLESDVPVNTAGNGRELAQGLSLLSELLPQTGEQIAINVSGLQRFLVSDVAFVGTPNVLTDASITLYFSDIADATINHCEFYGLRTRVANAGIVFANRSGLRIEHTKFLGSFGASGLSTPNVQNVEWKSISVFNVSFIDFGLRPELYCKCQEATYSWINIGNAAAVSADSPRREVSIRDVFLDEGGYFGLTSLPSFYQPPSAPIDLVYISGLRMNVSNFGTTGNYLLQVQRVLIENSQYGWSQNASSAILMLAVGTGIVDRAECVAAADRIQADEHTGSLTVINSTYAHLDSQAQVTRELTTTAADDPVQHVRGRFAEILGRDVDAAAHFYWSNLLVECGDDAQCVADQKGALDLYLNGAPPALVSIGGRILDAQGTAMANVTVTLSGSQNVTTQTDENGDYSFAQLPSSGIYNVTSAIAHYTLSPANVTVTTPSSDQTIDITASLNSYVISGRLVDPAGAPLVDITVNLSGTEASTVTTDALGQYSFTVPALGDYTITPANAHRVFVPAAASFSNLDGHRSADFVGSLVNYSLSGRVTVGAAPLPGVTITLSGSVSGTTTTEANGSYSFDVPALGNYTLTATLKNYTFAPAPVEIDSLTGNETAANFSATLNRHVISGIVSTIDGGAITEATVTLSGSESSVTTTDATGRFVFSNLAAAGTYTVVVAKTHYLINPPDRVFSDLSSDQTANFTASLNRYKISGHVINAAGSAVSSVNVILTGTTNASAVTGADGEFVFADLAGGGDYSITLTREHYSFEPNTIEFSDLGADQNLQVSGNPPPPKLIISDAGDEQLIAVDSVLLTEGPFETQSIAIWLGLGTDVNTRVSVFASEVSLQPGESPAALVVNLVDSAGQAFDVPAEYIGLVPTSNFSQIVFRLPDNIAAGTCRVKLTLHGLTSNVGTLDIIR